MWSSYTSTLQQIKLTLVKGVLLVIEGHCVMIKGSTLQKDLLFINVYAPYTELQNTWSKNQRLKRENRQAQYSCRFNTSPSNWPTGTQQISKYIEDLNNTISQLDITYIYRPLFARAEYTNFSILHKIFTK